MQRPGRCLRKIVFFFVVFVVFICNGKMVAADEEQELLWPRKLDLKSKEWVTVGTQTSDVLGEVKIWNTQSHLYIDVIPDEEFRIEKLEVFITDSDTDDAFAPILNKQGKPTPGRFPYKWDFPAGEPVESWKVSFTLGADLDMCWGVPEKCPTTRYIVVHAQLVRLDPETGQWVSLMEEGAFAAGNRTFERFYSGDSESDAVEWGWYDAYPVAKVQPGHFIDAPVLGLTFSSPTQEGITTESGEFFYIPRENVDFSVGSLSLGSALGDERISPVDLFGVTELIDADGTDDGEDGTNRIDPKVINIARLLQSLDEDGQADNGAIKITEPVRGCLDRALNGQTTVDFADDTAVEDVINATIDECNLLEPPIELTMVDAETAMDNLNTGQKAGNIVKKNVSKDPDMASDKAKLEIMPVYVPAQKADGTPTQVVYYDKDGTPKETRSVAKPIVVAYQQEVEGTGASDIFVSISRDDGDTWKRRNISRTADKSSFNVVKYDAGGNVTYAEDGVTVATTPYPGDSKKPMLQVKDNMIFLAWTDKYCRGGRPGYAITTCESLDLETNADGTCEVCRDTDEGSKCEPDYTGDDAYYEDDIYGVGGPRRSVTYDPVDFPGVGEIPYSCVWTARGMIEPSTGEVNWFKPERLTSGRRDANQLFSAGFDGVGFAIVWQEDPKGLVPGEGDGPGEGWSGANTHSKTDIWYSFIKESDFTKVDESYVNNVHDEENAILDDIVDTDADLSGRVKALVPMSLPVRVTDNDVCSLENMDPQGGDGEHDYDEEGQGTHRYCGTVEGIGTEEAPGSNPLCAYTIEKLNPNNELHHVCVTADGRLLDGNTGASRPNVFLMPYTKKTTVDGVAVSEKTTAVIIGYEESKGVGSAPDDELEDEGCGDELVVTAESEDEEDRYKPDVGKNVIYHSFDILAPELVSGGGIINLQETDESGAPVYLVDEFGAPMLDWKQDPMPAYENARRIRFLPQPQAKAGSSKTVLVALYRQGAEGNGKPADIFMRSVKDPGNGGNPYAFANMQPGAKNVSSVEPTEKFVDPFDSTKPEKMLRWTWTPANLDDSSSKNPYTDARAHRGSISGDNLIIGYSLTPNWGRLANDKYDFIIRRSFNGGKDWTTDPNGDAIEHNVVWRVPVVDYEARTVTWDEVVEPLTFAPGASEPPRNISNLRNGRISVMEPRLVKTPGTIKKADGTATGYPEDVQNPDVYQIAYGVEFNQNQLPVDVVYPQTPLDIYYGRTSDKGQHYSTTIVTPGDGSGKPEEGWNPLAKDIPEQGAAQVRQTPDGSRMYSIWLEEGPHGSDIMFRRVDYQEETP